MFPIEGTDRKCFEWLVASPAFSGNTKKRFGAIMLEIIEDRAAVPVSSSNYVFG